MTPENCLRGIWWRALRLSPTEENQTKQAHNDNDDDNNNNNNNNNNNEKMWLFICEGSTKLLTTRIYNNQEKLQVL